MTEYLYGRNAVCECLRARRRHIHTLILAKGLKPSPIIQEVTQTATKLKIPIQEVPRKKLDTYGHHHQGMVLQVGQLPTFDLTEILTYAQKQVDPPFLLVLDHLKDPQNVGAILRTAEAVGVHGVIIPDRRAASITPTVVNASAGATEHLRITIVKNLANTLRLLKKENIWIAGVEKTPKAQPYHQATLDMPLTLVLGSEGKGLSHLVSQICDFILALPMRGQIESLNASVASGLLLYEVWRSRQFLK